SINNRRLTSVPAELLEADHYQTARASYQYQPSRDEVGPEPAVSIAPAEVSSAASGAWVWNGRLYSRYAVDGTTVHWAVFQIQTAGQQRLRVTLPETGRLQSVWIDQQRLTPTPTVSENRGVAIELPSGRSFATLSLGYTTTGYLPTIASKDRAAFASIDIPIMSRQWSVWLPPGYEIVEAESRLAGGSPTSPSWTGRLFGILGRSSRANVFNPLVAGDWHDAFVAANDAPNARKACEQLIATLGTLVADHLSGEELTWGQLLALAGEAEAPAGRTLLVDAESL